MQSLTRASTRAGLGTTFILAVLCAAALAQFALLDAAETRRFTASARADVKDGSRRRRGYNVDIS